MARPQKTWGFQEREVAEQLKRMVGNADQEYVEGKVRGGGGGQSAVFFTPSSGIAARAGATLGSATCTRLTVASGTRSSTGTTETVYNDFRGAIAGSVDVIASKIDGIWVVHAEDCNGSTGTTTVGEAGTYTFEGGRAALSAPAEGTYELVAEQAFYSFDFNGSGGPLEPI